MPTVTGAAIRRFGRSCKVAVPDRAARRVVPRAPCKSYLQALVSQGFRLERREPFLYDDITPSGIAARCQIPPFVTYGDIFPRSGGSRPSRGRLWAIPQTLPHSGKPSPWGRWMRVKRADERGAFLCTTTSGGQQDDGRYQVRTGVLPGTRRL